MKKIPCLEKLICMRKTAKQQVEEIERNRFEMYMTLFLLDLGIGLSE